MLHAYVAKFVMLILADAHVVVLATAIHVDVAILLVLQLATMIRVASKKSNQIK